MSPARKPRTHTVWLVPWRWRQCGPEGFPGEWNVALRRTPEDARLALSHHAPGASEQGEPMRVDVLLPIVHREPKPAKKGRKT
jgi:hypothetical protein